MIKENIINIVKNIVWVDNVTINRVIFDKDEAIVYLFSNRLFYKIVIFCDSVDNKVISVNYLEDVICFNIYNINYFL